MTVIERATRRVRDAKRGNKMVGLIVLGLVTVVFLVAYQKDRLTSVFSPGDTVTASFTRQFKLENYKSVVKLAGVRVGEVTDVQAGDDGRGAEVTMRLDRGVIDKIGGQPSAAIRQALVVGGVYYIEVAPGGRGSVFNKHIPVERTTVPVELDQVLSPINPAAQRGLQGFVGHFDDTLKQGGREAIRDFLHTTPPALQPTSVVLSAFRGTEPEQDLTRLVSGLEGFAAVFNRKQGQFATILDSMDQTTAAFYAARQPIADTFGTLPETLRTTRVGLDDLNGSLDKLTDTAPKFRDSAQELDSALGELGPVIHDARPVVSDLNDVLEDAEPMLRHLVPVADKGTEMFHDIRGPVLDRVNGPVKDAVLNPWHGSGVYEGGGNDHPMYKTIAFLMADFADTWKLHDKNTATGRIEATFGGDSLTGGSQFPRTIENQLESAGGQRPLGPQDSDQEKHKGLSGIEQKEPINKDMPTPPDLGPFPGDGANGLLLPLQGGNK